MVCFVGFVISEYLQVVMVGDFDGVILDATEDLRRNDRKSLATSFCHLILGPVIGPVDGLGASLVNRLEGFPVSTIILVVFVCWCKRKL